MCDSFYDFWIVQLAPLLDRFPPRWRICVLGLFIADNFEFNGNSLKSRLPRGREGRVRECYACACKKCVGRGCTLQHKMPCTLFASRRPRMPSGRRCVTVLLMLWKLWITMNVARVNFSLSYWGGGDCWTLLFHLDFVGTVLTYA